MKQEMRHPSGGKLRGLFCFGLAVVLAAGVAFNSTAAITHPVQYDVEVKSSSTHTAALSGTDLYLWGTNDAGQFPGFGEVFSPEPVKVKSGIADVAVSYQRTLTVSTAGKLVSYGLDPGTGWTAKQGTTLAFDAVQVAASDTFAAYISKDGSLYTWGANDFGQLGLGDVADAEKPTKVEFPTDEKVKKVSLGDTFSMALLANGDVYGWGLNASQQLGFAPGSESEAIVKTPVKIAGDVRDVDTGSYHTCLLKNDGSLWTCGDNTFSQTGIAETQALSSGLTKILTGIRSVSAGSFHNFAVSTTGDVYTWGYGIFGQLGSGGTSRVQTPTVTDFTYVQVFACSDNTFGVSPDGSIYSFGNNTNYLLGKTDGSNSLIPMRILDSSMNWVYEDPQPDDGHDHTGDAGETAPPADAAEDPTEPEPYEPKVIASVFVSGYDDGSFRSSSNVTRAQFLRMLVSALCKDFNPEKDYGTCSFSDIPVGKWFEKYVAYAEQKGLINGYKDGTWHPNEPINRAEASRLVVAVLGIDTESAPDAKFSDVGENYWARKAINTLVADNTLHGYDDGTFRPTKNMTRGEAVTLVALALKFCPTDDEKADLRKEFWSSPFTDVKVTDWYYPYLLRAVGYAE